MEGSSNIMLSEIGQSEKAKNRVISLICRIYNRNSWTLTAVWWLPEGWRSGGGERGGLLYGDGRWFDSK